MSQNETKAQKRKGVRPFIVTLGVSCLSFAALALLFAKIHSVIIIWDNLAEVGICVAALGIAVGIVGFLAAKLGLGKSVKGSIVRAVACTAVSMAVLFGLLTANSVLFHGNRNRAFVGAAFALIVVMLLCLYLLICKPRISYESKGKRIVSFALAAVLLITLPFGGLYGVAALVFNGGVSVIGYTEGEPIMATRRDYGFDNSGLLIGGYCCNDTDTDEQLVIWAKEAGLEFFISSNKSEEFLTACDNRDFKIILADLDSADYKATLPRMYEHGTDEQYQRWLDITEEKYYADPLYNHPCLWGSDLMDEPLYPEFEKVAKAVDAFNKNVPGKIAYVNQFPAISSKQFNLELKHNFLRDLPAIDNRDSINDNISTYKTLVSTYINTTDTDYISVDIYPLGTTESGGGFEITTRSPRWLRNLDILAEACRKTDRDLWVITQSAGEVPDSGKITEAGSRYADTPEEIRWQYYVSLSFGAKALINALYYTGWWDTDSHMIDANKQRTDTYYAVQTAVKELDAFKDIYGDYKTLGAYLVNGKNAAGNHTNTLTPVEDGAKKPVVSSDDPILVGCFNAEQGAGRAYTLVNMWEPATEKPAAAKVAFEGASEITLYRMGEKSTVQGDTLELTLDSYEGVFVTVDR